MPVLRGPAPFLLLMMFVAVIQSAFGADALAPAVGSPAATPSPAPKIDFDSITYNFGRAKSGDTIKHDFIFTNSGNAALEIIDVKPGCGCTTAGTWDKKVEPGKTGVIPLQFNSTGFGGQISKSATITCNDPRRTNLFLQISGTVWRPIDVMPTMAMFNVSAEAPTNETKIVKIVSNLEEPITLSDLQCNNPTFKAELKEVKPGKEFELHVTAVPPFTSPTVFSSITLKTSATNAPSLSVSAYAVVQQPVMVSPQQVTLPAGPLKTPVTTAVMVRNTTTNSLQVSDVHLDLSGVDLKVTQPQTGRIYSISMVFPAGFEVPLGQKPELAMKTSHPKFPQIKVPVVQIRPMLSSPVPAGGATAPRAVPVGPSPARPVPLSALPAPLPSSR